MKPILTCAIAAAMAFTAQSVYAERDGHGRGAASSRASAPAARANIAPQTTMRANVAPQTTMRASAPRAEFRSSAAIPQRSVATAPSTRVAPSQTISRTPQRSAVTADTRTGTRSFTPTTTTTGRTRGTGLRDNSVAFGGSRTRVDGGRSGGFYRPPVDVYRDWDRGRVYSWHNHRYHWDDGAWVALDIGPDYYSDYYDTAPSVAVETSVNGDLVAEVQSALDRRGYNAGPVDGVAGAQTRDAIAAFQSDHGLAVNGEITDGLIRRLGL